jgi:hypothetical protein
MGLFIRTLDDFDDLLQSFGLQVSRRAEGVTVYFARPTDSVKNKKVHVQNTDFVVRWE